jgi:3-methyladenine DNA glycosylase AlkC
MPTAEELIARGTVDQLRYVLSGIGPSAMDWARLREIAGALPGLKLSERVRAVRDALLADLPAGYRPLAGVVRDALRRTEFTGWMIWPVTEAVATAAVRTGRGADLDDGLRLLAELTGRLTSEFALRTFLVADLDRTLAAAAEWSRHPDASVRRLASEGTRPKLPWARQVPALNDRPQLTGSILDQLYRDRSETVRRSVANHVNDISRIDPALAISISRRWQLSGDEHTAQVVRAAMRTLVKRGEPAALGLLGFTATARLDVRGPCVRSTRVSTTDDLVFDATITNLDDRDVRLAIDYVIHYRKANRTTTPRVFKLAVRSVGPGATVTLSRRHSFRPVSTRRHYPGEHAIDLQINGVRYGHDEFILVDTQPGTAGVPCSTTFPMAVRR